MTAKLQPFSPWRTHRQERRWFRNNDKPPTEEKNISPIENSNQTLCVCVCVCVCVLVLVAKILILRAK